MGVRGYGALGSKASMRLLCRLADRVISCTRVMEQEISRQFHPKSSAAVYNPCDIQEIRELSLCSTAPEFDAFFAQPGKIVASMGREHDVKGFWHLIKAAALARKKAPDLNLRLMIIGEGRFLRLRKIVYCLCIPVLFLVLYKWGMFNLKYFQKEAALQWGAVFCWCTSGWRPGVFSGHGMEQRQSGSRRSNTGGSWRG